VCVCACACVCVCVRARAFVCAYICLIANSDAILLMGLFEMESVSLCVCVCVRVCTRRVQKHDSQRAVNHMHLHGLHTYKHIIQIHFKYVYIHVCV